MNASNNLPRDLIQSAPDATHNRPRHHTERLALARTVRAALHGRRAARLLDEMARCVHSYRDYVRRDYLQAGVARCLLDSWWTWKPPVETAVNEEEWLIESSRVLALQTLSI